MHSARKNKQGKIIYLNQLWCMKYLSLSLSIDQLSILPFRVCTYERGLCSTHKEELDNRPFVRSSWVISHLVWVINLLNLDEDLLKVVCLPACVSIVILLETF
eukprot:TRINITY_DN30999_c0_g1_i1.p1 TRINITY_DN30999_c0_g1~~TRINITY_DN30999_c0_g1_i1.p1  ORF type:complete len:103 (-),score=3.19 TRINITY_DN30999_c0_g1_i1:263-571(-)